jgi:hypothetical protein
MAIESYDPKQILILIAGVPISGLADGTFVSIERQEDAFTAVSGADGQVARVKSNNAIGTLTLTIMQTSQSNQLLSGLALADQRNNAGTFPVLIKDNEGTTLIFSAEGWVQRMPTVEYSKDISNREWIITLSELTYNIGGNTTLS